MPDPITGLIGATLVGGVIQADAASSAASSQAGASQAGIEEQRRQQAEIQKLLEPWVTQGQAGLTELQPYAAAGGPALAQQQALAGLSGMDAQQAAIAGIESSPLLQAQIRQGENAMLQNASATGGLRGGNMQAALAQFRPMMLQQAIDQQYSRLGGLTSLGHMTSQNRAQLGQSAAAGVGSAGLSSASNIGNLLAQQGAAQAGGAFGQARAWSAIPQAIGFGAQTGMFSSPGQNIQDAYMASNPPMAFTSPF